MTGKEKEKYLSRIINAEPTEMGAIIAEIREEKDDADRAELLTTATEKAQRSRFVWQPGEYRIIRDR